MMSKDRFLVQTTLSPEDYETLKMLADMAGVSISDAVRMCVRYVIHEAVYVVKRAWERAIEQKMAERLGGDQDEA